MTHGPFLNLLRLGGRAWSGLLRYLEQIRRMWQAAAMPNEIAPVTQHADESVRGERGAQVTSVRNTIGLDKPLFTALALALSIFSVIFCSFVWSWEEKRAYMTQRCEGFIEQIAFEGYATAYTKAPLEIKTNCVVVINRTEGSRQ